MSVYVSSESPIIGEPNKPFHRPECQCEACHGWRIGNHSNYAAQLRREYSVGDKKRRRGADDIINLCDRLAFVAQFVPAANRSVLSKNLAVSALDTIRELRENSQILLPIKKLEEFEKRLDAVVSSLTEFIASNVKT